MIQRPKFASLVLCIGLASGGYVHADGFYTIIGPDGRPMIVPQKAEKKSLIAPPVKRVQADSVPHQVDKAAVEQKQTTLASPAKEQKIMSSTQKASVVQNSSISTIGEKIQPPKKTVIEPSTTQTQNTLPVITKADSKVETNKLPQSSPKQVINESIASTDSAQPFNKIDGVEYVNNEYLEDQEFNLDGKKRFYSMPDGTGRMETIERKKGVSRSVLDKFLNRNQNTDAPIVLSTTYVRLTEQDLDVAFENDRCFMKDYKKTIKTLSPLKEVGVWPTKPLKEKFEYELIKLEGVGEYAQIDSYAPSQEKPTYYWPLVVFLDDQGCRLEGVSGFKSKSVNATLLQHASIQGVIKIPSQARYLMMTPLASAIDLPEQVLSNQGQIRISALK